MKNQSLLLALFLTGCVQLQVTPPNCQQHTPPPRQKTSQYSIVNGSGYRLDLYQDGRFIGVVDTGQVVPIHGPCLWQTTVVSAIGRDTAGAYAGTASWIFIYGTPEAWSVTQLTGPHH